MLHTCIDQLPQKLPQARRAAARQSKNIFVYSAHQVCQQSDTVVCFPTRSNGFLFGSNKIKFIPNMFPSLQMVLSASPLYVLFAWADCADAELTRGPGSPDQSRPDRFFPAMPCQRTDAQDTVGIPSVMLSALCQQASLC
jgi:hypothetical protein